MVEKGARGDGGIWCFVVSGRRYKRARLVSWVFFFQAEDGIRDPLWSRGLGDVYKRQVLHPSDDAIRGTGGESCGPVGFMNLFSENTNTTCLLYTPDVADDTHCVDPGGCCTLKKKNTQFLLSI